MIVLSPFEVRGDADTGYLASTAQSGTRLRTDLKDIASSISVVTKDFMDDIGAKDLESLLVYTLGTEVNGVGGNFSDAGVVDNPNGQETDYDAAFASVTPGTRVRGLTSADLSRDFFVSRLPVDTYNIERMEISRGPNAMLFGLGSPSGIINSSLISSRADRNRSEVELRTDQYGSFRGVLDHNQVLINDKLALRVAGVYEDQSYKVEEAWRRNKRIFLTSAYRPFKDTTIKASVELGDIDSNMPEIRPPGDAYTQWWAMGRPAWNPSTNTGVLLGTPAAGWPTTVFTATGAAASTGGPAYDGSSTLNSGNLFGGQIGAMGNGSRQMVIVYNDPNSSMPSLGLPGSNVVGFRNGNYNGNKPNAAGTSYTQTQTRGVRDWNYINNRVLHHTDITQGFWKAQQISDPAIFNFYDHMLHGQNKHEWADFEAYDFTIDQRLFNGKGGAEFSFHRELLDNGNVMQLDSVISGYTLRIDMNSHLGDGRVNPNFGRPFVTGYSKATLQRYEQEGMRGTVYYDLDLQNISKRANWIGKLLGHHRLTGTWTSLDNSAFESRNNFAVASGLDYAATEWGTVNSLGNGRRGLPVMRFLGPDVSGSATPVTGAISVPVVQDAGSLGTANILYYAQPVTATSPTPGTWSEQTFSILSAGEKDVDEVISKAVRRREKIDSLVGVAQSYWWDGTLVSTLGWRRDKVRTYDAGSVEHDPLTGHAILDGFDPVSTGQQTETSFNYGLVLHSPQFIRNRLPLGSSVSLIYNQADNFRPAGQRYDIYDNLLPAETGESKEYGVLLSTLNDKLVFKFMKYETTSGLSSSLFNLNTAISNLAKGVAEMREQIIRGSNWWNNPNPDDLANYPGNAAGIEAFNAWYNGPVGMALRNTFRMEETGSGLGAEVNYDDRDGAVVATADVVSTGEEYEVVFNPTPQWRIALNANRAQAVRTNIARDFQDLMVNSIMPLAEGPAGALSPNPNGFSELETVFFKERITLQVYNQMLPKTAVEGLPANELREWRFNAITNYTFEEGLLKGWNIGGGVRWQDEVAIGFPVVHINGDTSLDRISDVHNPYYGPKQTDFDVWVGYTRKFAKFTFRAQLNVKNIGVGEELIPVEAQPDGSIAAWRIREPQYISLRTTFSF
jgi:outer membrane receptor protein involved in Fe transport